MCTMTNNQAGCEYCLSHKHLIEGEENDLIILTRKDGLLMAFISGDDYPYAVNTKFCPMCGRPFNLRPMTLEEAVAYGRPVWEEFRDPKLSGRWMSPDEMERIRHLGKIAEQCIRFWPDQPTPEQSTAWKWEEEEHE